jgi:hypothetical protein
LGLFCANRSALKDIAKANNKTGGITRFIGLVFKKWKNPGRSDIAYSPTLRKKT